MPLYEVGLILSPDLDGEERDGFIGELRALLGTQGATIVKEDVWGKRNLAYEIRHRREGFYLFWQFEAPGSAITALEYRLRLSDQVLRFLTINLDQELRRKRKFDVLRAERKARPRPAAETGARVPGGEV
jgi:small subunit ribosomal protein S6